MNIFEGNVKKAFVNDEFYLLFTADDKYARDESGNLTMAPSTRLYMAPQEELDPIAWDSLIGAVEQVFCKLNRDTGERERYKTMVITALKQTL